MNWLHKIIFILKIVLNLLAIANKIAKKNVSFHYFENFKDESLS